MERCKQHYRCERLGERCIGRVCYVDEDDEGGDNDAADIAEIEAAMRVGYLPATQKPEGGKTEDEDKSKKPSKNTVPKKKTVGSGPSAKFADGPSESDVASRRTSLQAITEFGRMRTYAAGDGARDIIPAWELRAGTKNAIHSLRLDGIYRYGIMLIFDGDALALSSLSRVTSERLRRANGSRNSGV